MFFSYRFFRDAENWMDEGSFDTVAGSAPPSKSSECWLPHSQLQQWSDGPGDVKTPKRLSFCHFGISSYLSYFKTYYVGELWPTMTVCFGWSPSYHQLGSLGLALDLEFVSPQWLIGNDHQWSVWTIHGASGWSPTLDHLQVENDLKNSISMTWYCWWKKSQTTTWNVKTP